MLQQVYESNQLVLEVVDDFSWLYRGTVFKNYKYYNDSHLFGDIPPYHIAHMRYFVNLDGHKLKRGLKVVASSIGHLYKHHFDIKKIMLPQGNAPPIQSTSTASPTSPLTSSSRPRATTSSPATGRPTKSSARTPSTCSRSRRATGWTSSGRRSWPTTIDCRIMEMISI